MTKTDRMTCAASEYSDKAGHSTRLISLRYPPVKGMGPGLLIKRTAKTLIRMGRCPGMS